MDQTSSSQWWDLPRISREQWPAVTLLFDQCNGLTTAAQEHLLAVADLAIANEVRSLLLNSDLGQDSFHSPAEQLLGRGKPLPEQIGSYRVERLLGQGGMGSVFLARRVGDFEQLVAVKLIRRDFGPAAQILESRFRQERQILASLQHPYIAHLIDGGTSAGQPYLVVEYVPGLRIDTYCKSNRLTIRQRIELFLKVCSAVQYAHQHLVVHRDLKPANVLVFDDGTPKLLDFGIAKLLRQDESSSDITNVAMKIFTTSYASPEQLRGEVVGTTTDVYSLGVMLFELLTGSKPHRVEGDSDLALLEAMCHRPPVSATEAIKRYGPEERSVRAHERSSTYAAWAKSLRNDLELILSRAISVDAARRYQSVEQFAADLNRYLSSEPILARNDTWIYRTRKFWGRHKALVSVASVASMLLIAFGIVLWHEYRIAVHQSQRAQRRFDDLQALARSNATEVQDALDRVQGGTAVRALILKRTVQYLDSLAAEKDNDLDLQRDLATTYMNLAGRLGNPGFGNLGDSDGAGQAYDRSIAIYRSIASSPKATEKDRLLLIYVRYLKGVLQATEGRLNESRQTLVTAAADSDAFLAGHPSDPARAYHVVSSAHRELAGLLIDIQAPSLADSVQALHHTDVALQAASLGYQKYPGKPQQVRDLIVSQWMRADALFAAGYEAEGLALERSNLDFANASPASVRSTPDFLFYPMYQYALHLTLKDPQAALPWAAKVLDGVKQAQAADPQDIKMMDWAASANALLGNVFLRAGQRSTGLKMTALGISQMEQLYKKYPVAEANSYFALATAHRNLGDDALQHRDMRGALREYQNADRIYTEGAARNPDDLEVYVKRSENECNLSTVSGKLGLRNEAVAARLLAIDYANRVLKVHPDNQPVQQLRLTAAALAP